MNRKQFEKKVADALRKKRQSNDGASEQLLFIGSHFDNFQRNGQGYKACCSNHVDSTPSLSLRDKEGGGVIAHCHAGCSTPDVLEAVGLTMRDLARNAKRVVAEYQYRNADGGVVYENIRYQPKTFRVRQADGRWSLEGVVRVLYRLPEILAAELKRIVILVEGEKDADRLASLGLVSTTIVGGANGPWLDSYSETLRGRRVVILPDNDEPGAEFAERIARSLHGVAKSVKIVQLPDVPEKGDVSDYLDAGGSKKGLLALVKRTPTHRPPPTGGEVVNPVGGGSGGYTLAPFPIDVLPKVLQQFITAVAEALPCPPDFVGTFMLPVLGTMLGRKVCVEVKSGWIEWGVIWTAVVARSGDRKSPSLDKATGPIREKQQEFVNQYRAKRQAYRALKQAERDKTDPPRLRQLCTTDATIEAVKDILEANPTGVLYFADELTAWLRGLGQYKSRPGDDRSTYLSLWSSQSVVTNRKSDPEPIVLELPFVAITGGIQPAVLRDLIDGREDGLAARFLFSYPDPLPPADWTDTALDQAAIEPYAMVCRELFRFKSSSPVTFDPKAKKLWVEWVNAHRRESPPDNLRPAWAKAEGYVARIALILHAVRQVSGESRSKQIDAKAMRGAIALMAYYANQAHRVYREAATRRNNGRIGLALAWIREHGGEVSARQLRLNGVASVKNTDEAHTLLADLAELGHGCIVNRSHGRKMFILKN